MASTRTILAGIGAAALLCTAAPASAAIVLSDDFDALIADVLNWTGDATFTSTAKPGSVDLIGAGGHYDIDPGHGRYVDLDGSTGAGHDPAGQLTSTASFGPGTYTLSFLLGGNARHAPGQTTVVSLGDFSVSLLRAASDPLAPVSFTFTTTTAGNLVFTEKGPSDNQGNILDDIQLSTPGVVTGIAEPASWALMILGFGGLGASLRARRVGPLRVKA